MPKEDKYHREIIALLERGVLALEAIAVATAVSLPQRPAHDPGPKNADQEKSVQEDEYSPSNPVKP